MAVRYGSQSSAVHDDETLPLSTQPRYPRGLRVLLFRLIILLRRDP
jgi:hypothetical protein